MLIIVLLGSTAEKAWIDYRPGQYGLVPEGFTRTEGTEASTSLGEVVIVCPVPACVVKGQG